jgi:hypothetical protein
MNRIVQMGLSVALLSPLLFSQSKSKVPDRVFRAASGDRVVIVPVGKTGESVVDFFSSQGDKLCSANYFSADGTHGFVAAKAEWTPDERYFVFSMQSSGGHQPWHSPTDFYIHDDRKLCHLDDFLNPPGIATSEFLIGAPNLITTFVYGQRGPATTPLARIRPDGERNGKPRCVPCEHGALYQFGETGK